MNSTGAHWENISFHKNFLGEIAIDAFFCKVFDLISCTKMPK